MNYNRATGKTAPIYMDTEFTSLSKDAELLSIGLIADDGEFFYAEITDYDKNKIDPWVKDHVIRNFINDDFTKTETLVSEVDLNGFVVGYRATGSKPYIKDRLTDWLEKQYKKYCNTKLQIYADVLSYDWMLFVDLLGSNAFCLPKYIYYIPLDLASVLQERGIDPDYDREVFVENYITRLHYGEGKVEPIDVEPPIVFNRCKRKHNALWDAYICRYIFKVLLVNEDKSLNI